MIFFCQKERTTECINKAMHAWKLDIQQLKTIISGKRVDYLLNGLGTTYYTTGINLEIFFAVYTKINSQS